MPIRLLRYLILSLCIPFAVAATEIDYKQIQKDLNSMDTMLELQMEFQVEIQKQALKFLQRCRICNSVRDYL